MRIVTVSPEWGTILRSLRDGSLVSFKVFGSPSNSFHAVKLVCPFVHRSHDLMVMPSINLISSSVGVRVWGWCARTGSPLVKMPEDDEFFSNPFNLIIIFDLSVRVNGWSEGLHNNCFDTVQL